MEDVVRVELVGKNFVEAQTLITNYTLHHGECLESAELVLYNLNTQDFCIEYKIHSNTYRVWLYESQLKRFGFGKIYATKE